MRSLSFDVLIEGVLPFDKYTRESNDKVVCTTTLVQSGGTRILVDPGMYDDVLIAALADRDLSADDIDVAFITHFHGDHYESLRVLPKAEWLIASRELNAWSGGRVRGDALEIFDRLHPAPERLADGVKLFATPGHTVGHTGVLLAKEFEIAAIVGDAVFTGDYLRNREPSPNAVDWNVALRTIDLIAEVADVVIPGHSGPFRT